MRTRNLRDVKKELQSFPRMIPWDDVRIGGEYHIPKILSIEPRDIKIMAKNHGEATYKRIDKVEATEGKFHMSSIFAVFLVKKRKY